MLQELKIMATATKSISASATLSKAAAVAPSYIQIVAEDYSATAKISDILSAADSVPPRLQSAVLSPGKPLSNKIALIAALQFITGNQIDPSELICSAWVGKNGQAATSFPRIMVFGDQLVLGMPLGKWHPISIMDGVTFHNGKARFPVGKDILQLGVSFEKEAVEEYFGGDFSDKDDAERMLEGLTAMFSSGDYQFVRHWKESSGTFGALKEQETQVFFVRGGKLGCHSTESHGKLPSCKLYASTMEGDSISLDVTSSVIQGGFNAVQEDAIACLDELALSPKPLKDVDNPSIFSVFPGMMLAVFFAKKTITNGTACGVNYITVAEVAAHPAKYNALFSRLEQSTTVEAVIELAEKLAVKAEPTEESEQPTAVPAASAKAKATAPAVQADEPEAFEDEIPF
jgi:hypothetical protein